MDLFGPPNISNLKGKRNIATLISCLSHKNEAVRANAATALGELQAVEAVDGLAVSLSDASSDVRLAALTALQRIAEEKSIPSIVALVENPSTPPDVRHRAFSTLGTFGAAGVRALVVLRGERDRYTREQAAMALAQLGKVAVSPLVGLLSDGEAGVREQAVIALGNIGDSRALDSLLRVIATDREHWVRKAAADAIGNIGDLRAFEALSAAEHDSDVDVQHAAGDALRKLHDGTLVGRQAAKLRFGELSERVAATEALAGCEDVDAVRGLLLEALRDRESTVRQSAATAIGVLKDGASLQALQAALDDESAIVVDSAVRALVAIAQSTTGELEVVLNHPRSRVRILAAEALGDIKNERSVAALQLGLSDPVANVRIAMAEALARQGDDRGYEWLLNEIDMHSHVERSVEALERVVLNNVTVLSTPLLRRVAELDPKQKTQKTEGIGKEVYESYWSEGENDYKARQVGFEGGYRPVYKAVNASTLREIARNELKRRGAA